MNAIPLNTAKLIALATALRAEIAAQTTPLRQIATDELHDRAMGLSDELSDFIVTCREDDEDFAGNVVRQRAAGE